MFVRAPYVLSRYCEVQLKALLEVSQTHRMLRGLEETYNAPNNVLHSTLTHVFQWIGSYLFLNYLWIRSGIDLYG